MKALGLHLTKISSERELKIEKVDKITTNIEFTNIEKDKIEALRETEILKVSFIFTIEYEPGQAKISFEGIIPITVDSATQKTIMKEWKKKKLANEMKVPLFNLILSKCTLKALELEADLNLPPHVKFPRLQPKED